MSLFYFVNKRDSVGKSRKLTCDRVLELAIKPLFGIHCVHFVWSVDGSERRWAVNQSSRLSENADDGVIV